jgi:hypothetical protein
MCAAHGWTNQQWLAVPSQTDGWFAPPVGIAQGAKQLKHIFRRGCELGARSIYLLVGTGRVVPEFPHRVLFQSKSSGAAQESLKENLGSCAVVLII